MKKKEQILEACEKALSEAECNPTSGLPTLMLCRRIARLTNDVDASVWLDYESSGYPRDNDGQHINSKAFEIACEHGRGYYKDGKRYIFSDLISELDGVIESSKKSIESFSTNGVSVGGEFAFGAMNKLVNGVQSNINLLNGNIKKYEKYRSILINEYYAYAYKKQIEIMFENYTLGVFEEYQEVLNTYFDSIGKDTLLKLNAIQDAMKSNNEESFSQALTTCRKMFLDISCDLFDKVFPDYNLDTYKTISGKDIDISGEHSVNKLSAVIEKLESKNASKTITGSNVMYLVDLLENINSEQSKGVHHNLTKAEANGCIIQTYITLGSIIALYIKTCKKRISQI